MEKRFKKWSKPTIKEGKPTKWNWVVQGVKNLKLGRNTDIGSFTYINAKEGVDIGDDVQIGSHCSIYSVSTIDNKKGKVILDLKWNADPAQLPKISNLFFISLLDDSKTVIFNKLSKDMATLLLAKETSVYLRGASNVVVTFNRQFPSFDNKEISIKRMELVDSIVSKLGVFVLRANLSNTLQILGEIFENK